MLTSSQLGDALGISKTTILKLAGTGRIPCVRLPTPRGDYRFDLDAVLAVLRVDAADTVSK